jgi:hypothetical protein
MAQTTTLASSTSATITDTNLSATITPSSSTSKILVMVTQSTYVFGAPGSISMYLVRNSSTTIQSWLDYSYVSSGPDVVEQFATNYLDSPGSTSAQTYKTAFSRGAGSGTVYCQVNSNQATIILMEIAP